jgi:hypothetical protein
MASHSPLALGLAAVLALLGCAADVAPIEVAEGCPEQPLRGPSKFEDEPARQLIDDFEHEDLRLPRNGGRSGFWVIGTEDNGGHADAGVSDKCAARGRRAGHFTGGAFSSWGSNWTALLLDQPGGKAVPYDATAYTGFSFWAAASTTATAPFSLPVGVTTMDVAWNAGICKKCMDYYRSQVPVGHEWRRFMLRFSELKQDGSGDPLVALRRDQLVGVIFWPDRDFDVWIDDLRFEP